MLKIYSLILLLLLSTSLLAEEAKTATKQLYNVEILVFSQTLGENSNEQWPKVAEDNLGQPITMQPGQSPQIHMQKKNEFELSNIAYTLKRKNNAYRLISHKKWQQVMYKSNGRLPVYYDINTGFGVLKGSIEITAQRFLHAHINLTLQRGNQLIPFIDKRKMRRDEVHYIDHPLLGIIVKTSRVETADEEE